MAATDTAEWAITAPAWVVIGAGMALIVTPTGRVIRASARQAELPAAFAAQFSLSHLAWLVTYPIAGWIGTAFGLTLAWSILAGLALIGAIAAPALWPREKTLEAPEGDAATGAPVDVALRDEAESAEGTLAACQCACVRTV